MNNPFNEAHSIVKVVVTDYINLWEKLSHYIGANQLDAVKAIIDEQPLSTLEDALQQALKLACIYNNAEIFQYLTEYIDTILVQDDKKHPINQTNVSRTIGKDYKEYFSYVCEYGHVDIAIYLKEKSPLNNYYIDTLYDYVGALKLACRNKKYSIIDYLVSYIDETTLAKIKKLLNDEQSVYIQKAFSLVVLKKTLDNNLSNDKDNNTICKI